MKEALAQHDDSLGLVRRLPGMLDGFRDMLLANLVMLGEIPAPSFGERGRIQFLNQRFTECGLRNSSTDESGNGLAILPGTNQGNRSILLMAHADTPFPESVQHTISVDTGLVSGPGVADNGLGLAVLATLPTILERLDIQLLSDLVLMGAVKSLGRGNMQGLRFFLDNTELPISAGISIEGVEVGRLNYISPALLGGEITCKAHSNVELKGDNTSCVIAMLNEVISRLRHIPVSEDASTTLVLGALEGGTSYKTPARSAMLRFQVRDNSGQAMADIEQQIRDIVDELSASGNVSVNFEVIARTSAGGLEAEHPLVIQARRIITSLGIQPHTDPFSTSVSNFTEKGIPSITIGISRGQHLNEYDEAVAIDPIMKGVAQLIGVLLAIDGGCCD